MAEKVTRAEDLPVCPDGHRRDKHGRQVIPGGLHGHSNTEWGKLPNTDALNPPARPTDEELAAAHETYMTDLAAVAAVPQMKKKLREFLLNVTSNLAVQRQEDDSDASLLDRIEGEVTAFETRLNTICQQYSDDYLAKGPLNELFEEIYDAISDTLNLLLAQEYAKAYEAEDKTPAPSVEEVIEEYRLTLIESLRLLALAKDKGVEASAIAVLEKNADEMFVNLANISMQAWQYTPDQLTQLEARINALYEQVTKHLPQE